MVERLQRPETDLAEDQFPSLLSDMKATQNSICYFKGFNSMPDTGPETQGKMVCSSVEIQVEKKKNTAYPYYYIQQYYIKQHRQDYPKQSSQRTCQTIEKDPRDSQTIQPWPRGQGTSMNVGVQAYLLRRVWVCSLSSRLISRQEMIRQHPPLIGPNRTPKS